MNLRNRTSMAESALLRMGLSVGIFRSSHKAIGQIIMLQESTVTTSVSSMTVLAPFTQFIVKRTSYSSISAMDIFNDVTITGRVMTVGG